MTWNPLNWFRSKPPSSTPKGKPITPPPPAERWLVEAAADLYFAHHRAYQVTTSTIIGEETTRLNDQELYVKYKAALEKWVEAHKKEVMRKKWTGSRGRRASLIRTANVDYVLYHLRIRRAEEN